jgi:Ion channel
MTHIQADGRRTLTYQGLFAFLVANLVLSAALRPGALGYQLYQISTAVILVMALMTLIDNRFVASVGLAIAIPAIGVGLTRHLISVPRALDLTGYACASLVLSLTCYRLILRISKAQRVTKQIVFGAMCAYLLLGYIGASVFAALHTASPESIRLPDGLPGAEVARENTILYFSFVTLTTLGYGDIVPVSAWARSVSVLLAIAGQLFVAVLLARFVSLYVAHSDRPADN